MLEPSGKVRSHWHPFLSRLGALGGSALRQRWSEAERLIRENGVSYNVHGAQQGLERPWRLDAIPLVIAPAEWARLEAGLRQRARLLELILADWYGPRRLLRERLLPAELLHDNPAYLRPCIGALAANSSYLAQYSADLGRDSTGEWLVLGDRTQAPSGAGYALENRIVLSRSLPEVFAATPVRRLAPYFRQLRRMIQSLGPHDRGNPRIVLLTPGPYNETYFEHSYLARYLSYTLVQGRDLTVRGDVVYLKMLGGLQPVDVIVRRIDDDWCDPLELRWESLIGVPGLLDAAREGRVAIANALGSGAAQATALLPFLPGLCRALLSEALILPHVDTWWCGQPAERGHVLAHLDELVIKSTFPGLREPVFGARLSWQERAALSEEIQARPGSFIAQRQLSLSSAPVLVGDSLVSRRVGLRTYVAQVGGEQVVLPGGLCRFAGDDDPLVLSMQRGGGSKDVWVLAEGEEAPVSLLDRPGAPISLNRGGGDIPSRVADNLYWLGRYSERCDGLARLARGVLQSSGEGSNDSFGGAVATLARALAIECGELANPAAWPAQEVSRLLFAFGSGAFTRCVRQLADTARLCRDRLSQDAWGVVQRLEEEAPVRALAPSNDLQLWPTPGLLLEALNDRVAWLAALSGTVVESMTRGHGWRFLDMGRRIERALQALRLLRWTILEARAGERALLEALLGVGDALLTFRRRYLTSLSVVTVADILLADETNPRSVAASLAALDEHLSRLPGTESHGASLPPQRAQLASLARLRTADLQAACAEDSAHRRPALEELLGSMIGELEGVSDHLSRAYFVHAQVARQRLDPSSDHRPGAGRGEAPR